MAAGKAPMQISTDGVGIPQKAIDGSTSAFYTPETCSLTKSERVPWWYVNLLEPYMVQLVRLDFGKACCGKLTYIFIFIYLIHTQREGERVRDRVEKFIKLIDSKSDKILYAFIK